MNLPKLTKTEFANLNDFIDFWSKQYIYSHETMYSDNIKKARFKKSDIQNLFEWKNQMKLSRSKQRSLDENILKKIKIINSFKAKGPLDLSKFKDEFKKVSAVWKIFLLHIIKPDKYPIYDQHVHRTYNFINKIPYKNEDLPINNKQKEEFYCTYLKFIEGLKKPDLKKLDKAFFSFGKFIKTYEKLVS